MSTAVFACRCGYSQAIDPVHVGKQFSCPNCKAAVTAAYASAAPVAAAPPPAPRPQPVRPAATAPASPAARSGAASRYAQPQQVTYEAQSAPQAASAASGFRVSLIFGNVVVFVLLYILLMVPTYFLPWIGSNSTVGLGASIAAGTITPMLAAHLLCMLALIGVVFLRGYVIGRIWLIIFPILAAVFEFVPGLNWIPFIPTILHIVTIVLGVIPASGGKTAAL